MGGEVLVINPRRRGRRRTKRARSHRRKPRRTRRHLFAANPRRGRRRSYARARSRRRGRRRVHHNPRLGLGSLTSGMNTGVGIGIGVAVTEIGVKAAVKFIPGIPAQLTSGLGLVALKIGVGAVALPFILKMAKQHKLATNVAIGAWVSVVADVISTYITPKLGLGEYVSSMSEYSAAVSGAGDDPDGFGAAENMYGDTMYGY